MPECVIIRARSEDIEHVADNLRPDHRAEIGDLTDLSPALAARMAARVSESVFAGVAGGRALLLFGVERKPLLADAGSVWMLATPEIDNHPIPVAKALRRFFRYAHRLAGAEALEQWLPFWYTKGVKWLLWLGWEAEATRLYGPKGLPHIHMIHREKRK